MTKEEAINELKEDKALYMPKEWIEDIDRDTPDGRLITALDMAIKALERDTPMKVNVEQWIYTKCPSGCGYELSTHHGDGYYSIDKKPTFCPKCGQRLDWGCDND